ncbi:low temperature requirement protein A [Phaeovulum sp. W22_SRMD_FR3]|uniref:low temperature requirement protein A n=1 Tax=Phaeovulum sp. W22_SRMD_FR3 TaxID=3240274 RepID=UPI003F94A7FE
MPSLTRPMLPRNPHEAHRAATPLELLFDLVSVIAIAAAAAGLHHALAAGHAGEGVVTFLMAFFAIWWAWMNFTWFASAYDNDDALHRILTMIIMAGALMMAAAIPALFETGSLRMVVLGYVVMRVGMVAHWLRAGCHDNAHRRTALRYAAGIALVQVYWLLMLVPHPGWTPLMFLIGVALELAVPAWAERASMTPWHRHHIMERYGLLTIIVLGETLLAGAMALEGLGSLPVWTVAQLAGAALVIVFGLWWLYFAPEEHLSATHLSRALTWGYGHFGIFAAGAAVGAGFAALIDTLGAHAHGPLTPQGALFAVAVPVAIFLAVLWAVRDRYCLTGAALWVLPVAAVLILLSPLMPGGLTVVALLVALTVWARSLLRPEAG